MSERKTNRAAYDSLIENMKLYGYPAVQARIQLDAVIEEALGNAGGPDRAAKLGEVVGNHSVMLHDLKEKIQSMVRNASNAPGDRLELWEVIAMLLEWADECDRLTEEEVRKLGIQKLKKGAPYRD